MNVRRSREAQAVRRLSALLRSGRRASGALRKHLVGPLRHAESWGWEHNIVGVALGWKSHPRRACLTLFVRRRFHPSRLTRREFIPEGFHFGPRRVELLTDVVEVGGAARLHSYTGTLRSGLSVGHEHAAIGSGSIGVLLERSGDEHAYFVSCAHVIALARAGRPKAAPGQFIEQPYDEANDPADADAAVLANDFSPLTEREVQTDDFAIARLLPGDSWDPALKGSTVSVTALSTLDGPDDFAKGMEVTHYGAANGPADGIVTHVEGNFRIPAAGESEFDEWIYRGLIAYSTDSDHGDSGGAVVEAGTTTLVGLHTGGFENSSVGFFFPIGPTLAALGYSPISARPKPAV